MWGEGVSARQGLQPGQGVEGGTLRSPLFFLGSDGSWEEGSWGVLSPSDGLGSESVFFHLEGLSGFARQ